MINNILVPIDLSINSYDVLKFAEQIAVKNDAKLCVFHAYHLQALPDLNDIHVLSRSLEDIAYYKVIAQQKIAEHLESLQEDLHVNVELVQGLAVDTILSRANEDIDLIVMGNRQAANVIDKFFGSISSQVARRASCPVICVPIEFEFEAGNWVLAWDLTKFTDLTPILPLLQIIKSHEITLDLVHFSKHPNSLILDNALNAGNLDRLSALFDSHDIKFSFQIIEGENFEEAIACFAEANNAAALIVIPKHHDWLTKLFGKSHSKDIIEQFVLPVISVPSLS